MLSGRRRVPIPRDLERCAAFREPSNRCGSRGHGGSYFRSLEGVYSFAASETIVAPSLGLVVWTALVVLLLVCGAITAAKGRWGWVGVGLLTGGLPWVVTAFLKPSRDSLWARIKAPRLAR